MLNGIRESVLGFKPSDECVGFTAINVTILFFVCVRFFLRLLCSFLNKRKNVERNVGKTGQFTATVSLFSISSFFFFYNPVGNKRMDLKLVQNINDGNTLAFYE